MLKNINVDNEEEILKECDFDYFYKSKNCSRELCCFYNDITMQRSNFNKRQARIDLGIIAITLNKLSNQLAEKDQQVAELKELLEHERLNYAQLESDYKKANELGLEPSYIKRVLKENEELKQQLAEKEKENANLEKQVAEALKLFKLFVI